MHNERRTRMAGFTKTPKQKGHPNRVAHANTSGGEASAAARASTEGARRTHQVVQNREAAK
jgi:hypothetical protein